MVNSSFKMLASPTCDRPIAQNRSSVFNKTQIPSWNGVLAALKLCRKYYLLAFKQSAGYGVKLTELVLVEFEQHYNHYTELQGIYRGDKQRNSRKYAPN